MKFEQNLKKLESIVESISDDNTSLDEGIALYEQGISIAKVAIEQLQAVDGKIKVLKAELDKIVEEDF